MIILDALSRFLKDEKGQSLVEYLFILLLVAVVMITTLQFFGNTVDNKYGNITEGINAV